MRRINIEDIAHGQIKTAEFLADAAITLLGKRIDCRVVRATYQPEEDMPAAEVTFWIEKERGTVRKQSVVAHYSISTLQPLRELVVNEITSYNKIEMGTVPESLFNFVPPGDARPVPRLFLSDRVVDLTGLPAPQLKLRTFDGAAFDTTSLKGHPVLIEFWASW